MNKFITFAVVSMLLWVFLFGAGVVYHRVVKPMVYQHLIRKEIENIPDRIHGEIQNKVEEFVPNISEEIHENLERFKPRFIRS